MELERYLWIWAILTVLICTPTYYRSLRAGKFRFSLVDAVGLLLAYASVLAAIRTLLISMGQEPRLIVPMAIFLANLAPVGVRLGNQMRDRVVETKRRVRFLAMFLGVWAPMAILPALAATVFQCLPANPLRNDLSAVLAWLVLLLPCLGFFWFRYIDAAHNDEAPPNCKA